MHYGGVDAWIAMVPVGIESCWFLLRPKVIYHIMKTSWMCPIE